MSVAFKTPVTVVLGKVGSGVALWSSDKGEVIMLGELKGMKLFDELKVDKEVSGHLAITSFSYYIIKAIDLGSNNGSFTINERNQLVRIPSNPKASFKKFDDWYTIKNSFILIGNPEINEGPFPLICPYRVGDTLFINLGYAEEEDIKNLLTIISILSNNVGKGIMSTTTLCRVPSMPVEIALIDGDKYLMIRTPINNAVKTMGNKYLIILTSGGNIIKKYSLNAGVFNALSEALSLMRS